MTIIQKDNRRRDPLNTLPLHIQIDFRSGVPIYIQISDQIRQFVVQGNLTTGSQLPTVRQLATELRINYNTVARAYRLLDETGLISTQQGRGTYIWEEPTEEMRNKIKLKTLEELSRNFRDEVAQLGFTLDDAISELKRIQTASLGDQKQKEDKEM
jgi:GntR family transcriptional regulator